jgi:hypothetical protein
MAGHKRSFGRRAGVAFYDSGVRAFIHRQGGRIPGSGGRRNSITRFSSGSRRRMRDKLLVYRWGELVGQRRVVWCTFTALEGSTSDFKAWLSAWRLRFFRFNPGAWFLWRLEYQSRGVAHFHVLAVFPSQAMAASAIPRMLSDWLDCASPGGAGFLSQDVRFVHHIDGLACYITDASKRSQTVVPQDDACGRWWGFRFSFPGCDADSRSMPLVVVSHCLVNGFRDYVLALRVSRCLRSGTSPPFKVVDSSEFFPVPDPWSLCLTFLRLAS